MKAPSSFWKNLAKEFHLDYSVSKIRQVTTDLKTKDRGVLTKILSIPDITVWAVLTVQVTLTTKLSYQ